MSLHTKLQFFASFPSKSHLFVTKAQNEKKIEMVIMMQGKHLHTKFESNESRLELIAS